MSEKIFGFDKPAQNYMDEAQKMWLKANMSLAQMAWFYLAVALVRTVIQVANKYLGENRH